MAVDPESVVTTGGLLRRTSNLRRVESDDEGQMFKDGRSDYARNKRQKEPD